jgi:hypothetical protein
MSKDNNSLKIKLFNTQFMDLVSQLSQMYPEDSSLILLQTSASGMIYMNPESFASTIVDYLAPYNEKILARDESFFLNEIKDEFEGDTIVSDEIKKVHSIWISPDTTDETKSTIWKYFIFMVKLGKTMKF